MEKIHARQYKPFTYKVGKIPLIVYPVKDENPLEKVFDPSDKTSIAKHLDELYKRHHKALTRGEYQIVFVWNLKGHRMTDVWINSLKNWSDSGKREIRSFLNP